MNVAPATQPITSTELRRQWVGFCSAQNPTHALTLAYNCPASFQKARADLRAVHARIDRELLGRRFNTAPSARRTWFVGFCEHPDTNAHLHLVVRAPPGRVDGFERLFPPGRGKSALWTKLAPGGTYAAEPLPDLGWTRYAAKDLTPAGEWILSDEFLPDRAAA